MKIKRLSACEVIPTGLVIYQPYISVAIIFIVVIIILIFNVSYLSSFPLSLDILSPSCFCLQLLLLFSFLCPFPTYFIYPTPQLIISLPIYQFQCFLFIEMLWWMDFITHFGKQKHRDILDGKVETNTFIYFTEVLPFPQPYPSPQTSSCRLSWLGFIRYLL